ncbi:hypothetical protein [Halorussus salinisoli]|uniref:hypothetical protein n=1 Tax=Halorussus salinisoli TaxID=2558242 RepID=UPI0010C1D17A|nr:hypothetical protein [Halorussus salinisoli]
MVSVGGVGGIGVEAFGVGDVSVEGVDVGGVGVRGIDRGNDVRDVGVEAFGVGNGRSEDGSNPTVSAVFRFRVWEMKVT